MLNKNLLPDEGVVKLIARPDGKAKSDVDTIELSLDEKPEPDCDITFSGASEHDDEEYFFSLSKHHEGDWGVNAFVEDDGGSIEEVVTVPFGEVDDMEEALRRAVNEQDVGWGENEFELVLYKDADEIL